jgi:rhamnosyltransferase subunit B
MRIVLNTFGSFGDVHPYLALAIELQKRGHDPLLATAEVYRAKIESAGISFAPVAPNLGELLSQPEMLDKLWHPRTGPDFLIRRYVLPALDQSFDDLIKACRGADLFLSHAAGYAGPVVAERLQLRWLSVVLQPLVFFSAFDAPLFFGAPLLNSLYKGSGPAGRLIPRLVIKGVTATWARRIHTLRKHAGLPAIKSNPLLEGQFSPYGTLALFSHHFASPQRDWPPHTEITGFPFYDQPGITPPGFEANTASLARFLDAGPPPVLFTLGSSAVMQPGSFYQESLEASVRVGFRAVLLVGLSSPATLPNPLPPNAFAAAYLPYSDVMSRCSAIVHHGGIGTTAQAFRAGKPTVIAPWGYDQPDNAERARKLGVSQTLSRSSYSAERVGRALAKILDKREGYIKNAASLGLHISAENGAATACDALERAIAVPKALWERSR